jgi:phosphosulfolactate synthase
MVNSTLATRTIWLVRHGESTWNRLGLCQGHNDEAQLTERGQRDARAARLPQRPCGRSDELDARPERDDPARGGRQHMISTALRLPGRTVKPRTTGLTMVIDGGIPLAAFTDMIEFSADYIDYVKFGWGTAVVTGGLRRKIDVLNAHDIGFYFGGTLFEKYVLQGRFEDYRRFCFEYGASHAEVSNGTIEMSNHDKASYIRKLAGDFEIVSEVGFKDPERSEQLPPSAWIEFIREDLDAGAGLVTLEARESGKSGICRPDGALRFGLIEDVLMAGIGREHLLFEAPSTELQAHFITRIGPDVNLGNIPASAVISLETLRLGLRGDTLTTFEERSAYHS